MKPRDATDPSQEPMEPPSAGWPQAAETGDLTFAIPEMRAAAKALAGHVTPLGALTMGNGRITAKDVGDTAPGRILASVAQAANDHITLVHQDFLREFQMAISALLTSATGYDQAETASAESARQAGRIPVNLDSAPSPYGASE